MHTAPDMVWYHRPYAPRIGYTIAEMDVNTSMYVHELKQGVHRALVRRFKISYRTAKPTSSHLPATLRTQPGAGRARAPLHHIHHLRGGVQRRRRGSVRRPRRSLHIFQALCCPSEGPTPSRAQRWLPPGGTLKRPLAALPNRKAPPYPRERRPRRVAHRRSGSRCARHARGQRDAGVPHAGGKPWAGPSGIRLAIPIGVPQGGGWLLNDRQSHKVPRLSTPTDFTLQSDSLSAKNVHAGASHGHSCRPQDSGVSQFHE
eukprot:COSAG01_NODE_84_length_27672_cov_60.966344_21_plen_259_part_00